LGKKIHERYRWKKKGCRHMTKYLAVVVDRGITSEVMHFISFDEARTAFGEVAHDHGYEPEETNESDYYDVSIWEWTEDRYHKIYGY